MQIGERVGAIISASPDRVRMFGYGTYQGEEIPPSEIIGPFGPMKIPNPKILLDSGEVVWGCECWWGPEVKIQEAVGNRPVQTSTPAEYRSGNFVVADT